MGILAIYPSDTTPAMYDDADEFRNRATDFLNKWGGEAWCFDSTASMAARKKGVLNFLKTASKHSTSLAFFCHGWSTKPKGGGTGVGFQAGFRTGDIPELAEVLKRFKNMSTIYLFCCSCAAGDRNGEKSIAARLRDATDLTIWAHVNPGHTVWNPNYIVHEAGYIGGYYPIPRGSKLWPRWVKELKAGLWIRFPDLWPWDVLNGG